MSISQEKLFSIALGLEKPWYIKAIEFNVEEKQLDLHIDFESGSRFPCPICGKSGCPVHDTIERTWRHLNFFQFKTYLHCRVPRTECDKCGVKQVKVPWARKASGFTLLMDSLIVLMAQTGSFVPAKAARIGVVDKIFTRVGASDNISLGESTFMVEMNETASILNNLSDRSLILLDEIGRGTSTYDGISIAWAMVEYLHESRMRAKTLFATHYHELNEMENSFSRVKNYNVSIREMNNKVIFLRKLKRGGSEHSFGIHVAKMAGMPRSVVNRADEILRELEQGHEKQALAKPVAEIADHREGLQLSIFQLDDPVLKQIRDELLDLDINNLTPVEALNKLYSIRKYLK